MASTNRHRRIPVLGLAIALVLAACGTQTTSPGSSSEPAESEPVGVASAEPTSAEYPSEPVDFVSQSSAGGGADTMARVLAEIAEESGTQPLLVVNRSGAGGANLQEYVNARPADGHTVIVTTSSSLLLYYTNDLEANPATEWRPVIRSMIDPNVLVVDADTPWQTAEEVFAAAEAGDVVFGGGPVGSVGHIILLLMGEQLGFDTTRYSAYPGQSDSYPALIGGQIDATVAQISEVGEFLESGDMRALLLESPLEGFEDVPTFADLDLESTLLTQWRGFHVLADTPDNVVTYLHDTLRAAMEDDRWTEYLTSVNAVDGYMGPDEFQELMQSQDETLSTVLTDLGIIGP